MQMKKINRGSLKKFKIKRHFIITGHNQSLTSFPELLVKLSNILNQTGHNNINEDCSIVRCLFQNVENIVAFVHWSKDQN
jgi:hypothetical protein